MTTPTRSTHTPGPWKVYSYVTSVGAYNKGLDVGCDGRALATVIGAFEEPEPGPEAESNARLIAAAPELLTLVRDLVEDAGILAIDGGECPTCGRDNSEDGKRCTSDDCMGVQARALLSRIDGGAK